MRLAVLLAGLLVVSSASARTAQELLNDCEKYEKPGSVFDSGFCIGYLDGATDAHLAADIDRMWVVKGARLSYCTPKGVTLGQIRRIYVKYAQEHPAELHLDANRVVHAAMREAFPCPATQ